MGVAVSNWVLASAVSRQGHLGVVSGTAIAIVLSRRLQLGDPEGHVRRALSRFPVPAIAERVLAEYYIPGGKDPGTPFRLSPALALEMPQSLCDLTVAGAFVEVFLAKEGHGGLVGMNLLEKVQLATLPSLLGAMLAGVDYVLVGAGIPRWIPGALDHLAAGQTTRLRVDVEGALPGEEYLTTLDPAPYLEGTALPLPRPEFLAIVSSSTLASTLARKSNGKVDGFVIEGETAGGHNAPPRGPLTLTERGEPRYGPRDAPDLPAFRALGLPFWLAGSYGRPGRLAEALALGAAGIQVGTAFAFCEESGILPGIKHRAIEMSRRGEAGVFTDPLASPTGFPFKVAQVAGSLSEGHRVTGRSRLCDIGYLRRPYRKPDGTVGYRCPAEPEDAYLRKGGRLEDTLGHMCVCNALPATVGLGQVRANGETETPLVTAGNDFAQIADFLAPGADTYTAADVVRRLLAR